MTIETQSMNTLGSGESAVLGAAGAVVASLRVCVLVANHKGVITYRNPFAATQLPAGDDLASVFAKARFLLPFDGWSESLACVLDTGDPTELECVVPITDARTPVLVTITVSQVAPREKGEVDRVVVLMTHRRPDEALEQKLEVSTRLASLGKLASRVAHELNNPLDGILRYINLAMRHVDDAPESKLKSYLVESRVGLMRMVQIIGDLLEYSRTTDGAFDAVGVNDVVEQAIQAYAAAAEANGIVVAADFRTQEMPCVSGVRPYQVFCNLIKNAIDAMPDGGRLTITTAVVGDSVMIEVRDTGPGLPDPCEKVFEPFFTTKEPGKGTGLGLAICRDFVEEMQGTLTAETLPEGGAAFVVRIPTSYCVAEPSLAKGAKG